MRPSKTPTQTAVPTSAGAILVRTWLSIVANGSVPINVERVTTDVAAELELKVEDVTVVILEQIIQTNFTLDGDAGNYSCASEQCAANDHLFRGSVATVFSVKIGDVAARYSNSNGRRRRQRRRLRRAGMEVGVNVSAAKDVSAVVSNATVFGAAFVSAQAAYVLPNKYGSLTVKRFSDAPVVTTPIVNTSISLEVKITENSAAIVAAVGKPSFLSSATKSTGGKVAILTPATATATADQSTRPTLLPTNKASAPASSHEDLVVGVLVALAVAFVIIIILFVRHRRSIKSLVASAPAEAEAEAETEAPAAPAEPVIKEGMIKKKKGTRNIWEDFHAKATATTITFATDANSPAKFTVDRVGEGEEKFESATKGWGPAEADKQDLYLELRSEKRGHILQFESKEDRDAWFATMSPPEPEVEAAPEPEPAAEPELQTDNAVTTEAANPSSPDGFASLETKLATNSRNQANQANRARLASQEIKLEFLSPGSQTPMLSKANGVRETVSPSTVTARRGETVPPPPRDVQQTASPKAALEPADVEAEAATVEEVDVRGAFLKNGASGGGSFTMRGITATPDSLREEDDEVHPVPWSAQMMHGDDDAPWSLPERQEIAQVEQSVWDTSLNDALSQSATAARLAFTPFGGQVTAAASEAVCPRPFASQLAGCPCKPS